MTFSASISVHLHLLPLSFLSALARSQPAVKPACSARKVELRTHSRDPEKEGVSHPVPIYCDFEVVRERGRLRRGSVSLGRFVRNCRAMLGSNHALAPAEDDRLQTPQRLRAEDGIVMVDHGSRREESNVMIHEFVHEFKERTGQVIVEGAHMELASPTIADAFDRCVEQGAARVIISPYFLFPGRHWDKDIPALVAKAAQKHPSVPYVVTAPIGLHKLMVTVISDRIQYCLDKVAGDVQGCDMCLNTGGCQQLQHIRSS